eukprot:scaffold37009_cov22-Cyclotella_meneghiniana.AAC.1
MFFKEGEKSGKDEIPASPRHKSKHQKHMTRSHRYISFKMMPSSLLHLLIIAALIHQATAFTSPLNAVVSRRHNIFQQAFESDGIDVSESDVEAKSLVSTRQSFVVEALKAAAGISIASST